MENLPVFKDDEGTPWTFRLTTRDIDRVRDHVKNKDGQPVDLLDMAERGDFSLLITDMRLFPTVCFWCLQSQVADLFNVEQYDYQHAKEYELDPSLKLQSTLQKAANWFGSRLGGDAIADMAKAFTEAILNFIDPRVREKLQKVLEKQEELQRAALDKAEETILNQLQAGLEGLSKTAPPFSESTQETTPSAS